MNFLVDAHLPMRLANWLKERGHNVIHTRELPLKNEVELGNDTVTVHF